MRRTAQTVSNDNNGHVSKKKALSGYRVCLATSVHAVDDTRLARKIVPALVEAGATVTYVAVDRGRQPCVPGEVQTILVPDTAGGRLGRVFRVGRAVHRAALDSRPDLTLVPDPELLPWFLLNRTGALVYDMHEDTPAALRHRHWLPGPMRGVASALWGVVERLGLRRVPTIFAEDSYGETRHWIGSSTIVRNYARIDDLIPTPDAPPAPFRSSRDGTLVYVGAISAGRGAWEMIDLARVLALRGSGGPRLTIIGPCAEPDLVAELSKGSQEGWLRWPGRLSPPDAWKLVSEADVGLALLRREPNYMRSLPTKILEYAALGLRVVATDIDLYRDVIEGIDCGRVVDPANPAALLEAVDAELELARGRRRSAAHHRTVAAIREHWSWDSEKPKLVDFLSRSLEGGGPPLPPLR